VSDSRYVQVRPDVFQKLVERHGFTIAERWVLLMLLMHADYTTGIYKGTQADLGKLIGLDRRNLRSKLARLEEADIVDTYWPLGHEGAVRVKQYLDLVRLSAAQGTNHPLRKGRLGDLREVILRTSLGTNRPNTGDESSLATPRKSTSESRRVRSVEATTHGEVAAVVDISKARNRDASQPQDATPSRAPAESLTACETTPAPVGAWLRPAVARVGRGLDGGGSEATPVHPRSRRDAVASRSTNVGGSRDPRAVGGAS